MPKFRNYPPLISVHANSFHADDVCAVGVLRLLLPDAELIRTRDQALIAAADFAVDVGGEWDPERGRFDHHQKGFTEKRPTGVLYASSGLVWLAYGAKLVQQLRPDLEQALATRVRDAIDDDFVQYLDMTDTGAASVAPGYFGFSAMISAFNVGRSEEKAVVASEPDDVTRAIAMEELRQFDAAVAFTQDYLRRLIGRYADRFSGEATVRGSTTEADGRILVLDESGLSWSGVVCGEMPAALYVVYPETPGGQHQVRVVPVEPQSFQARQDLPKAWAGLRDRDLSKVTGVEDAVFCHNNLFIAGARSKEGALRLAHLAVEQGASMRS